jgi:site-specific recombinase XerD
MKSTPASPADNLSPFGGAVISDEVAGNDRDLVVLSTPADEPPVVESSLADDSAAGHAPQSGDRGAAIHAGSVKKEMPPVLAGHAMPALQAHAESFYRGVAEMFERWAARHGSSHTRRAYRRDVLSFVEFLSLRWPEQAEELLRASVADVQRWRDAMRGQSKAPKTLNRRISSLSSFYKYLAGAAAEFRLPINVPNPAHAQFIARESSDPLEGTRALSATRARQLMGLPAGDGILDYRDRAILRTYLYTGVRLATACRLRVRDFHQDGDEATLTINEKGNRHRTIGIHFAAAEAIAEYIAKAGLESGPLFRARRAPRAEELGEQPVSEASMYRVVADYLARLPGAVKEGARIFSTHSLRATTATLLLDAGVDIRKVQELLGHRHVTTTQIYDKRRRTTKESASHDVPI